MFFAFHPAKEPEYLSNHSLFIQFKQSFADGYTIIDLPFRYIN